MNIEIPVFDFGETGVIYFVLPRRLVQQRGQVRPCPGVAYDPIPRHIAIQLGQKVRKILDQFLSLNWRKCPNRSFDFAGGAHQPG